MPVLKRRADEAIDASSTSFSNSRASKARKLHHDVNELEPSSPSLQSSTKRNSKVAVSKRIINAVPTTRLNVYVMGTNESGELGLGAKGVHSEYRRPYLNSILTTAGVVQLAPGGMHAAALTHDNKVLTWGVNDLGALGRDTAWDGGYKDIPTSDDKNEESSENDLNPREATPIAIDPSEFPSGTVFVQLIASDSATFALTDEGLVYGWGTFKSGDGNCGFSPTVEIARKPTKMPTLSNIKKLASGTNHIIALNTQGAVLTWGYGEQYQTGRKTTERHKGNGLIPQQIGLSKGIVDIGSGNEHSFAVHENGKVFGWGLNNFMQAGIQNRIGDDFENVLRPTEIKSLRNVGRIVCIGGGNHHSFAVTDTGTCFTWGRWDTFALGIKLVDLPSGNFIKDDRDKPRILTAATPVTSFKNAISAAAGSDQSIGVSKDGDIYSWGFNSYGETGQGDLDEVEEAKLIDHPAVKRKRLIYAGCGGHFSFLAEVAEQMASGTH